MKRILITILVLALATAAVAAPNQNRRPAPPPPQQQGGELLPPEAVAEFLELSESQLQQIETLSETLRATVQPLFEQQRTAQEQLKAAIEAGNAQDAGTALLTIHNLGTQIKAAHDTFTAGFEGLLTPSQKAKWDVYKEIKQLRSRRGDGPRD